MKAIFGLHAASRTVLSINAGLAGPATPVLTIERRDTGVRRVPGQGSWSLPLEAGDYIVELDDAVRGPVRVSVSPQAVVVSTVEKDSKTSLVAFWSPIFFTSDPKDPWPPAVNVAMVKLDASADKWFGNELLPRATTASRGASVPGLDIRDLRALLIGIDDYPAGADRNLYRSCRGSVRDILEVEAYLHELGVPAENITRLVAPVADSTACPRPGPEGLPTYDNITAAWLRLADEAPAGGQVYIHYAGHGGRARTRFPGVKGPRGIDEVLAPCDINDRATGRYLRDIEVALLLERMSQRGQAVTLVVDSCNAGGITRGEADARVGDEDDLEPRAGDERGSAIASQAELDDVARRLATASRDRRGSAWFFGSSPHVLLAACRQNELAHEYAFDGSTPRGALTYFWLEALRGLGARPTYRGAHQRVLVSLHAHFRDQSPVLVGDGDRVIFGTDHVVRARTIPILRASGGQVELAAGQAHMLRVGTRLAVVPAGTLPELVDLAAMPVVEVTAVEATTATARPLAEASAASTERAEPIATGSEAVVLTHAATLTRSVRLVAPAAGPHAEAGTAALVDLERAIAADTSNLVALAGQDSPHYLVSVEGDAPVFRLRDAAGADVAHLGPPLPIGQRGSVERLIERLVHLARFASVLGLADRSARSPLAGRLGLELLRLPPTYQEGDTAEPEPFAPGEPHRVADGGWFCVRLVNRAATDLHVVVLDLQPDWGISRLIPSDASTIQLAPGEKLDTLVKAWLPDGIDAGADVIKAIATLAPTDYDWLLLDSIGAQSPERSAGKTPSNELEALMAALARPDRPLRNIQQPPSSRWTTAMVELLVER